MNTNRALKLVALAAGLAALALVVGPARAQDDETQGFTFRVDPIVLGVLETDVDTDSARFEEYRDLDSGFLAALDIEGEGAGGDRTFDFTAVSIGRDDGRYTLGYGLSGRYGLTLDYNKIPHRFGNRGRLLWTETSAGVFEIADPVQRQIQDAVGRQFALNRTGVNFAFLDQVISPFLATAQFVDVGLQRNRTLARFDLGSLGGLSWALEYSQENRDGNRPYGASFGFNNVTELPEPIHYQTSGAELRGEWNGKRGGARVGYRYSAFENDVSTLFWDNPWRFLNSTDPNAYQSPSSSSINGAGVGFADLAPDNQASLLFADGRTRLGGGWVVSGSLAYGIMEQDDPLLPFTLNSAIVGIDHETGTTFDPTDPANLPVRNADLQVDTLNLTANAGTRFGETVGLNFRYRYYDYDNQSERIEFPGYVRFHAVWEEIPRITVPFSFTRQDLGTELTWDVLGNSLLGLGYRLESWDREFREVDSTDEDIFTLFFDTRPGPRWNLRASYEIGDRSIGDYRVEAQEESFLDPEGVNNQAGLRKYDEAARTYDQLRLTADFFPSELWSLTVGVTGRTEDYDESELGLLEDEILQYNAEVAFTPGENLNVYLFGHRSDRTSFMRGRQSGATPSTRELDNWDADFEEVTDTWGLGLTSTFATRWTADLSGRLSRSDGFIDFFAFPGGLPLGTRLAPIDIGNYEDIELLALLGRLDYRISQRATAGFAYRHEEFTIDSFILEGLRNYLPGALLINANNGDYDADLFAVDLKLSF